MDTSSSSTVTVYDFLEKMRNPASLDLVRAIKSFIVSFSFYKPDPDNDGKRVQEFYSTMEAAFVDHPLWAGASSREIDSAMEGLEKYVMTKLFHRTFASSPEDVKLDSDISEKIRLLQTFLRPEHLDIPQVLWNEGSWLLAEKELLKINAFKAPREKLLCIISCCRVINNLMLNVSISEDHLLGGADVFLPILIYVTIKANPPQLHSNLKFIQLFRRQETLVSEPAYYFTNLVSAKSFIIDLKAKSLSIEESEFEAQMQAAKLSNSCSQAKPSSIPDDITSFAASRDAPSTSVVDRDADIHHNPRYPYMEAEPGELTVEDVGKLLSLYKDAVRRYTALCKAVGNLNMSRAGPSIPIFGGTFNISECSDKENNGNKGRREDE